MWLFHTRKLNKPWQYGISILTISLLTVICFTFTSFLGYRVVALIQLLSISLLAMLFDILPVLVTAILSALIWNFFFIPPVYTFQINGAEDFLMFMMYFVIALINAVLTFNIREAEYKARDKEEKVRTIKLYNTLLNSLSHEIRTPLATIIGSVDTLKENEKTLSNENKELLINEIGQAGIRLNQQVENLLNMSRLESGMLRLKADWCDLNELIFSVIQKLSSTESQHKLLFEPDENLPLFKLDAGLIETALYNLIHNAIQYTPDHSKIKISAALQHEKCCIVVSDNGNGFPESEVQHVFEKFYRLPQSKTGGTGLGLSIVKGFVEAHHGEIRLSNNKAGGAKFTIIIPAETSYISNLKNE